MGITPVRGELLIMAINHLPTGMILQVLSFFGGEGGGKYLCIWVLCVRQKLVMKFLMKSEPIR